MMVSGSRHRPLFPCFLLDSPNLRPVKGDRRTAISGVEVSGIKGYATHRDHGRTLAILYIVDDSVILQALPNLDTSSRPIYSSDQELL